MHQIQNKNKKLVYNEMFLPNASWALMNLQHEFLHYNKQNKTS